MGQYYKLINLTKQEYLIPHNGVKLMEFSYCNSLTISQFNHLLATHWYGDEVICAGDYTESTSYQSYMKLKHNDDINIYSYASEYYAPIEQNCSTETYDIVVNITLKEYVQLSQLPKVTEYYELSSDNYYSYLGTEDKYAQLVKQNPTEYKAIDRVIYAPSLLLATANDGGGTYHGSNEEEVGRWTSDHEGHKICVCKDIQECKSKISNWEDYKEIHPDFIE